MKTIKELYKIGPGPSSSHTIGPKKALEYFLTLGEFDYIIITLYGSLAFTGKGHLTDKVLKQSTNIKTRINFDYLTKKPHPNTLLFEGYKNKELLNKIEVYSVGGGNIKIKDHEFKESADIYPLHTFKEIKTYCRQHNIRLSEYVRLYEDKSIDEFIHQILNVMLKSIDSGLSKTGVLPGCLEVRRRANTILNNSKNARQKALAYAYAVAEENASGMNIVTAPTCGASGVLPAVIKYSIDEYNVSLSKIIDGMLVASLIGNLIKTNASVSGAECGCQAEIGSATSMASAYLAEVLDMGLNEIEAAAEMSLEHFLGLTCDPVKGYVQIPCIERNALAATRAIDSVELTSLFNAIDSKVNFDICVLTMLETGKDLNEGYRETAIKGLAKNYSNIY